MFSGKKLQLFTVIKKNMQIDLCMCATETAKCRRGGEMKATAACARASGCYDGCEGERAGVPASKPWFAIAYANTHIHIHTCIHNFCICAHIICCNFREGDRASSTHQGFCAISRNYRKWFAKCHKLCGHVMRMGVSKRGIPCGRARAANSAPRTSSCKPVSVVPLTPYGHANTHTHTHT